MLTWVKGLVANLGAVPRGLSMALSNLGLSSSIKN